MALPSSLSSKADRILSLNDTFNSFPRTGHSSPIEYSEEHVPTTAENGTITSPLLALPAEIRTMVYECVLVSTRPLYIQQDRVANKTQIFPGRYGPRPDIDSNILRTCQTIYTEALPILYQCNTFVFFDPFEIIKFKDAYLPRLGKSISALDGLRNPYGRLTLIRSVILHLNYVAPQEMMILPDRGMKWSHWSDHFFAVAGQVGFPALEKLVLDFSSWKLEPTDGVVVRPIVKKLTEFGCLQELTVVGLAQVTSLAKLRLGLVKPDGLFNVLTIYDWMCSRHHTPTICL